MAKQAKENALQVILKEQGVSKETGESLAKAFGAPFTEAGEILGELYDEKDGVLTLKKNALKVTSEEQTEDMAKAREQRLALKKIRTGVEAKRKELKEDALKAGRVIDSVARYVKQTIKPAEEYLQLQEDYIKIKEAKAAEALLASRREKVIALGADPEAYNLGAMSEGMFEAIIEQLETAKKKAADEAAAEERLSNRLKSLSEIGLKFDGEQYVMNDINVHVVEIKTLSDEEWETMITKITKEIERRAAAKEAEDKRIREENERLKAEAEAKEKAEAEEREQRAAAERQAEQERQAEAQRQGNLKVNLLEFAHNIKTVEDADKNLQALKDYANSLPEADQVLDVVQAAYNKSKSEIIELRQFIVDRDAKAEADRKAAEEAKAKAEAEERERAAMLAPDKDKLTQFAEALEIIRTTKLPAVQSNAAQQIVNTVNARLADMASDIKEEAAKL